MTSLNCFRFDIVTDSKKLENYNRLASTYNKSAFNNIIGCFISRTEPQLQQAVWKTASKQSKVRYLRNKNSFEFLKLATFQSVNEAFVSGSEAYKTYTTHKKKDTHTHPHQLQTTNY